MLYKDVYMGTLVSTWMNSKKIKYITFSVTDDCNLKCKYCYFTHKTNKNRMDFETAKKAVDYILSENEFLLYDGVVWDFIGGEPTLEMQLIDEICEYILYKMYTMNHKWLYCYRFMIGTNGLLYSSEEFQKFIKKHGINLHVNVTIDGTKEKHDLSRIKKDGTGSYDDVVKILPYWFKQTGNQSTKATFSHEDLPFLKDSIVHLWDLGFKNVMANVVFEDVWEEGDDTLFENQLKQLADYIIENKLWDTVSVRFFSPEIGFPVADEQRFTNYCGSGNMLAIDYKGNFYPCIRFMDSALNNNKGRIIGNSDVGVLFDRIRAFNALTYDVQSPQQCINCDIASGCAWCSGLNYDCSKDKTIFERQVFNCKMHKANVRANRYFWKRYEKETGFISPLKYNMYTAKSSCNKYLFIYKSNEISMCHIKVPKQKSNEEIDSKQYKKALEFCEQFNLIPVHVGFKEKKGFGYYIGTSDAQYTKNEFTIDAVIHDDLVQCDINNLSRNIIYTASFDDMNNICEDLRFLASSKHIEKISLVITDYHKWTKKQLKMYKDILIDCTKVLFEAWVNNNFIQFDVITDNLLTENKQFCNAGVNQWFFAPNGNLYSCIGDYYNNSSTYYELEAISNLEDITRKQKDLHMCSRCDVKHCQKCYHTNRELTCEECVPFELHCVKANIELLASYELFSLLKDNQIKLPFEIVRTISKPDVLDPLVKLYEELSFSNHGFYKIN